MMESEALRVNLEITQCDPEIHRPYLVLLQETKGFLGIQAQLEPILKELCHPYRNHKKTAEELLGIALRHLSVFLTIKNWEPLIHAFSKAFLDCLKAEREGRAKRDIARAFLRFLMMFKAESKRFNLDIAKAWATIEHEIISLPDEDVKSMLFLDIDFKKLFGPDEKKDQKAHFELQKRFLKILYSELLKVEDIAEYFNSLFPGEIPENILHALIPISKKEFQKIYNVITTRDSEIDLAQVKSYLEILEYFERLIYNWSRKKETLLYALSIQLYFLKQDIFEQKENIIKEFENTIRKAYQLLDSEQLQELTGIVLNIINLLPKDQTTIHLIEIVLKESYERGYEEIFLDYLDLYKIMGFVSPSFRGISEEWQILYNSGHPISIKKFIEQIERYPEHYERLLKALICQIRLKGVFIKDTDLFGPYITRLINVTDRKHFFLLLCLLRQLPVFFNEIGAEGPIRDVSTEIDEIEKRKDELVHFLRKHCHVLSNSKTVDFMKAIFNYWFTGEKGPLKRFLPPDLYLKLDENENFRKEYGELIRYLVQKIKATNSTDILKKPVKSILDSINGKFDDRVIRKMALFIQLYHLMEDKYSAKSIDIDSYLFYRSDLSLPDKESFKKGIKTKDRYQRLRFLLNLLKNLKDIITSHTNFEPTSSLYEKRHIAFDIPSVYGYYREVKFDAAGLFLRISSYFKALSSDLVSEFIMEPLSKDRVLKLISILRLMHEALLLEGLNVKHFEIQLSELEFGLKERDLQFDQILDILKQIHHELQNLVHLYYEVNFVEDFRKILLAAEPEELLSKFLEDPNTLPPRPKDITLGEEIFLRDMVSESICLQELDELLNKAIRAFYKDLNELNSKYLNVLIGTHSKDFVIPILENKRPIPLATMVGAKAYFLFQLTRLGYRVPKGFVISTKAYPLRDILWDKGLFIERLLRSRLRLLEFSTKKSFGKGRRPLLLSARSGAKVSMPGMMHSVLNIGVTKDILKGGDRLYEDSYRRFLISYASAWGIEKHRLKELQEGCSQKELIGELEGLIRKEGIPFSEDPYQQLKDSISAVISSWNSPKARAYREVMDISHNWGTAVIVQEMVFGNLREDSGAGVLFSHNMKGTFEPNGDVVYGAQGEEVVSGTSTTYPLSRRQARRQERDEEDSLEVRFPGIYQRLSEIAYELSYRHQFGPVELEFAFEGPQWDKLFLLQMRQMPQVEKPDFGQQEIDPGFIRVAKGIGVYGAILKGRIVFNIEEIRFWRQREPNTRLILVREDTAPDDILELYNSDGLLTSKGGATSHAAIVALRLKKTAVVGCGGLFCKERKGQCSIAQNWLKPGSFIIIDGSTGNVFVERS